MTGKQKTKEYIKFIRTDGKAIKRTIYIDANGTRYVYNQNGFWKLEDFAKTHKTI